MKKIKVKYFAVLREQIKKSDEFLSGEFSTAQDVLDWMYKEYPISVSKDLLKVAVNGEYQEMNFLVQENDTVVFIPPVAGG